MLGKKQKQMFKKEEVGYSQVAHTVLFVKPKALFQKKKHLTVLSSPSSLPGPWIVQK